MVTVDLNFLLLTIEPIILTEMIFFAPLITKSASNNFHIYQDYPDRIGYEHP